MPEQEENPEPLPITPSLHQWLERCAVRKCEPDHQSSLLSCFGPMIRKQLGRFDSAAAGRLKAELFTPDIVGHGDGERDRAKNRLVGFCDRVLYDTYKDQTDEMTRGLKAHLFSLEAQVALHELSKYRFNALIEKSILEDYSLATTPPISEPSKGSVRKPSQEKVRYYPDSIHRPDFVEPTPDDLWCPQIPSDTLPDVNKLLNEPEFDENAQRILWLRNYKHLFVSKEAESFTGLGRAQLYNRCKGCVEAFRKWLSDNLSDYPRAAQIEFVRQVIDTIEKRLLHEGAIPEAWLPTICPPTNTPP